MNYPQAPQLSSPQNVAEPTYLYDCCLIGPDVPASYNKCYPSFSALSEESEIPFFDVRSSGEVTRAYTNMGKKGELEWPFFLETMGVSFVYETPYVTDGQHTGQLAAAKFFISTLPWHCWIEFSIKEDLVLIAKPHQLAQGYGPMGSVAMSTGNASNTYDCLITSGESHPSNRLKWRTPLPLPTGTKLAARLKMSDYAKRLLRSMQEPHPLDFGSEPLPNRAMIEMTLGGIREVQQRGEWHR
jgi:hypothetical protein